MDTDEISQVNKYKITCPCCLQEIISPRGELQKLLSKNAGQIQIYKDELTKINKEIKNAPEKTQEVLKTKKETIARQIQRLNEQSNIYKKKRQILSQHETVSAYFMLKKVLIEKYGEEAYIECMKEVMNRVECEGKEMDIKTISIV